MEREPPRLRHGHAGYLATLLLVLAACGSEADVTTRQDDDHTHTHGDDEEHDHLPPPPGSVEGPGAEGSEGLPFELPPGFPMPKIPEDNPLTAAGIELGRHLFYDARLSANETQSCASCHEQALAFTDGVARSIGSTGEAHPRSAMSLANVGYYATLTWVNPVLRELERQALVPLFGEDPVELGLSGMEDDLLERLAAEPRYPALFAEAFPDEETPVNLNNVARALASFQRSLISGGSAYDRYLAGETESLSAAARRGLDLFFDERTECFHCHGGFAMSDAVSFEGKVFDETPFHNTALYDVDGLGSYPEASPGLVTFTGRAEDRGRFRAPTLRNVAVTAPYMHDGSIATLDEVLDHYAAGGRTLSDGPHAGTGSENPYKSEFLSGFTLTGEERQDLLAFLESLTDWEFLGDPRHADPW
jgi:cytochrome c peroxidase